MSSDSTEITRVLTDAEFDGVSGGEYVANGVARAVLQWYHDNSYTGSPGQFNWDMYRDMYCPK